jgi:tetratricopeptide (TPR) repeat protein
VATRPAADASSRADSGRDGAAVEIRDRLQRVEQLQAIGRLDEAVAELLIVATLYSARNAQVKAVAVLRQAARIRPENADVRMAYGEVLHRLRMTEDAVREYGLACRLLEAAGRHGEWLEVLRRLLAMDSDNLAGRLQLAEALSRAGRSQEAIESFRSLAELLLERGETDDWEKVAERLVHHDPRDVTTAHDLALHYARSGRHPNALSKLVLCYEAVPSDPELLERIIDTLESLGQREKAAALCRELFRTFRRNGLPDDANRTLQRLYGLDPDDEDAKEYMGVMRPAVAVDTVLELAAGPSAASRRSQIRPVEPLRPEPPDLPDLPDLHDMPDLPDAALEDVPTSRVVEPRARKAQYAATHIGPPAPTARPSSPVRPQAQPPAPTPAPVAAQPAPRPSAPVPVPANRPSSTFLPPARVPLPPPPARRYPTGLYPSMPVQEQLRTSGHAPSRWDAPTSHGGNERPSRPIAPIPPEEPPPLVTAEDLIEDFADHLTVEPDLDLPPKRPESSVEHAADDAASPVASARRRSNSLPRPRLARRPDTVSELPTTLRDMSKDLTTLDFFIERGFHESAVALLDALQKRHPDSLELQGYRGRIERMTRG